MADSMAAEDIITMGVWLYATYIIAHCLQTKFSRTTIQIEEDLD